MKDAHGKKTLYEVLGVPRDARAGDIRDAYSRLTAEMRKESAPPDPHLAAMAKVAVETLTDPAKRAEYDKSLGLLKRVAAPARSPGIPSRAPAPARRKSGWAPTLAVAAVVLLAAGGGAYW